MKKTTDRITHVTIEAHSMTHRFAKINAKIIVSSLLRTKKNNFFTASKIKKFVSELGNNK